MYIDWRSHGRFLFLLFSFLIMLSGCLAVPETPVGELPTTATAPLPSPTHTAMPTAVPSLPTAPTLPVVSPYPAPTITAVAPSPYPIPTTPPTLVPTAVPPTTTQNTYLPVIMQPATSPPPTDTPIITADLAPTATPIPVLDFALLQTQLRAQGQELGYVKIGFHTAIGGNSQGLDEWMHQLDAAGVPFFLKSVDNAQPLFFAQELMKQSGVPHTLVFRRATGDIYDVPNYDLPPDQAAREHWERHMAVWPPELDPGLVWLETMNEVDKNRAEWLAQFALTTAELALASGHKWAAFGWASGEPEPAQWQSPAMLQFLRLVAQHPDQLAIALHEYSYTMSNIADQYPYKVGRFLELFRICDANAIPRPTILITEWGWTYEEVPSPDQAMRDIAWASHLYAPFPQIKGAAIWYLGGGFSDIANLAQQLIAPVMSYALTDYFVIPPPDQPASLTIDWFNLQD